MDQTVENVVIVGSGPAGWAAAIYAARANLKPLVIEGDPGSEKNRTQGTLPLGQLALTTEIENYPGWPSGHTREFLKSALGEEHQPYWVMADKPQPNHGINGPELMELMRQQAKNFGTRIESKDVVKVDLSKQPFTLTTHDGLQVRATTVIVATGARANYLGLPSEDAYKNRGVSACAVCDGALPRFRNKGIAVIGGGDSAVEEATYLAKFGGQVNLLVRKDTLRASKIMQQRALDNPKVRIHWNTELEEVLGSDEAGVTGALVRNNKTGVVTELPVSGLFLAIGHTPNTSFLAGQLKLTDKGYIAWTTPNRTYTSVEGVFAAGDVADDYYRQAITAAGSGCMAALDAERYLAHHGHI
jgi:thioredoxin reductase (NADPH)